MGRTSCLSACTRVQFTFFAVMGLHPFWLKRRIIRSYLWRLNLPSAAGNQAINELRTCRSDGHDDTLSYEVSELDSAVCCQQRRTSKTVYVERNIEACSCNHGCSGITTSITYSACVCSLSYLACNAHARFWHLWPVRLCNIFPHYLINGTIFGAKKLPNKSYQTKVTKQKLPNKRCVFWFPLHNFCLKHFPF